MKNIEEFEDDQVNRFIEIDRNEKKVITFQLGKTLSKFYCNDTNIIKTVV